MNTFTHKNTNIDSLQLLFLLYAQNRRTIYAIPHTQYTPRHKCTHAGINSSAWSELALCNAAFPACKHDPPLRRRAYGKLRPSWQLFPRNSRANVALCVPVICHVHVYCVFAWEWRMCMACLCQCCSCVWHVCVGVTHVYGMSVSVLCMCIVTSMAMC